MKRRDSWKVVTLGTALAGLSVAGGLGAAPSDNGSPGSGPASVSPASLFNEPRWLASGSGGHGGWVDWGPGWVGSPGNWGPGWLNPQGCIGVTGPFGNVSGSLCI
jgi:hypothetical protein